MKFRSVINFIVFTMGTMLAMPALAAGGGGHVDDVSFSFEGPFGHYDTQQLQRGLKVYTEVCSACHGLKYVPIRSIGDKGGPHLPRDQVSAYAKLIQVPDEFNLGDTRVAKVTDHFPDSAVENAPDLSLVAKSKTSFHGPYGLGINQLLKGGGGPEYLVALLKGYKEAPACAPPDFAGYYNTAFTKGSIPDSCKDADGHSLVVGSWISMAPPLVDGQVDFDDGHANDLASQSKDVAAFLMWAAEPKLDTRKKTGFVIVLFLAFLSIMMYLTNRKLWHDVKNK